MWSGVHDNIDPAIASISVILIAVTTIILVGRMIFSRPAKAERH
jgi:putative spermidine/putrescine transport system permease protein